MVANETMIRIKPQVWEMINFEKRLGESMSQTIERVFQERFDHEEKFMEEYEQKIDDEATKKAWEGERE
jgi:hypothetical protein